MRVTRCAIGGGGYTQRLGRLPRNVDARRSPAVIDAKRPRIDFDDESWKALRHSGPSPCHASARAGAVAGGRGETSVALGRAERLVAEHRYAEAIDALGSVAVPAVSAPDLALRVLFCEAWARMYLGHLDLAVATLERARALAEGPVFTDVDRAEAMFRLGCCRLKLGKVSNAISLFSAALALAERGGVAGDALRARIFDWRSRCYQLQREWDAAQVDAERSLELAEAIGDPRLAALALMQCSLVAERRGDPLLARFYAERARDARSRDRRPPDRGAPPEQPRRPELPARRARERGRRI